MVELNKIHAQLTKLGVRRTWLCSPEIKQLQHILMDDEDIIEFVSGRYHGGFAILVATPVRLLLVDKKPLYLTVDDIRYDMISEVDLSARFIDSTITIYTVGKEHSFTSIRQTHLRNLSMFVQKRVMELRHFEQVQGARQEQQVIQRPQLPQFSQAIMDQFQQRGHDFINKLRLPAQITHRAVGAAAMKGSRQLRFIHPYIRGSFMHKSIVR